MTEDAIFIPRELCSNPIVGAGLSGGAALRPKSMSRFEAWLTLMFKACLHPVDRVYRGNIISLDRGEVLVSRSWLARTCRWQEKESEEFLRGVDDGEIGEVRQALPEWPTHGVSPFILRILRFEAAGGDPSEADGNIGMYLGGGRRRKREFFSALSVYQRANIPMAVRRAVYERDGYACVKCGATMKLSLDHIIAVTSGGDDSPENLRTLCLPCNIKKGGKNGEAA